MKDKDDKYKDRDKDMNRDPISGKPGAHPLGTGAGAASGGIAGAAAGMAAGGPVGSVAGAAIGAVAGGLAGKGIAEKVNPTEESAYWQKSYKQEPYYVQGKPYDYYEPGYRAGWEGRVRYDGRTFEEAEDELSTDYNTRRSARDPEWDDIQPAAHAAWDRVDRNISSNR